MRTTLKNQKDKIDRNLLAVTLVLTVLGLIAVADASAPQALSFFSDKFYFVKQQAIWAIFGVLVLFLASRISYKVWEKLAIPIFIVSLLTLILVLIPGVGIKVLGARRWIILGPVSIQPSELIKLALSLFMAKLLSRYNFSLYFLIPIFVVAGLIMFQPDLGTTLIVVAIAISQLFVSGLNLFYLVGTLISGAFLSLLLVITSDYRRQRLLTFLKQSQDPLGSDYHIRQVLLALGSGGLFGVGLGQGRQKYLFLPEAASDSIFAAISEEIGFLGSLVLISLFLFFVFRAIKIARTAPDRFSQILAVGIVTWIGVQIFLNIGSMVALVPLTGVPLPFFSYGGSSLVMILLATGILLNISKYAKQK